MSVKELQERESNWVVVTPIAHLHLTEAVNYELQIGSVTFIDSEHLPYRRKRLGFPQRISELRDWPHGVYEHFFDSVDTFAVVGQYGAPNDIDGKVLQDIRDSLSILALSKLGFARRRSTAIPAIAEEEPTGRHQQLFVDSLNNGSFARWSRFGNFTSLKLNENWKRFQSEVYFLDFLKILHGEADIERGWRLDLKNAAILAGQSQGTLHLPQAFLWNMMVIELLLTRKSREKGKYSDTLPDRAEAFLGWSGYWEKEGFEDTIRDAWKKRCDLVHHGKRKQITLEDLFFTDDLVLNLFLNITGEIERFNSKDAIVEFADKVEAERLLGIEPAVRPESLRMVRPHYTLKDFERTQFRR